jgi:hypothetical protein
MAQNIEMRAQLTTSYDPSGLERGIADLDRLDARLDRMDRAIELEARLSTDLFEAQWDRFETVALRSIGTDSYIRI